MVKKITKCKKGFLLSKNKCIKAPEFLTGRRSRPFKEVRFDSDSYAKDYKKANAYAKKHGGEVYTMVDAPGTSVDYEKGVFHVNRLAVVVLK